MKRNGPNRRRWISLPFRWKRSNRDYGKETIRKKQGIVAIFKWKADLKEEEMEQFAADALRQIDEKRYDAELIALGVAPIFKLGIAFSGKRVKVKTI